MRNRTFISGILSITMFLLLFGFLPGCGGSSSNPVPTPTPSPTPSPSGWTYTSLHPEGSDYYYSTAYAIHNGKIGGSVVWKYGTERSSHAAYWPTPTAAGYVDLSNGKLQSNIFAMSDDTQAGYFVQFGAYWHSVPMDMPNFVKTDTQAGFSTIYGLSGNLAIGAIQTQERSYARLWNLKENTLLDLSPEGTTNSGAWAIYGATDSDPGVQAGKVDIGAALWHGTAASYVNLHPDTLATESDAWAVYGNMQGGYGVAVSDGKEHAMLWNSTAASAIDIHPVTVSGVTRSFVQSMADGIQVGFIELNEDPNYIHAFLWRGSASDYLDLHLLLSRKYSSSRAWAVEKTGNNIWVVGSAFNDELNRQEAMLWRYTTP